MKVVRKKAFRSKIHSVSGLARIHVILIVLIAALAIALLQPVYRAYQYHGEWLACRESLRVVNGALVVQLLSRGEAASLQGEENELVHILPGREGYCPTGGTIYFLKGDNGEWKAVCGAHDSDHAERTRLNAAYVLRSLREQLLKEQSRGNEFPQELSVELNGRTLTCALVTEKTGIRRGTSTTRDVDGTVAFYGISGSFTQTGNSSTVEEGEICYFCFADEDNSASWQDNDGWGGSAYGDRY